VQRASNPPAADGLRFALEAVNLPNYTRFT